MKQDMVFEMYRNMSRNDGNIVFSPYSINTGLAALMDGAVGRTRDEIANVVGEFHAIQIKGDEVELNSSNSFWIDSSWHFLPTYIFLLKEFYNTDVIPVNYKKPAEENIQVMNNWICDSTNGKIRSIITPELYEEAKFILINSIYFNGSWERKFPYKNNKKEKFLLLNNESIDVDMMNIEKGSFRYTETDSYQVIEIPYLGYQFNLILVLPKENENLHVLESALSTAIYRKWLGTMRTNSNVDLKVPKFKIESEPIKLIPILKSVGINDAFIPYGIADFSLMDGTRELVVDKSVHKSLIEVDEEGTKSASVTVIKGTSGYSGSAPTYNPVSFNANRPFLFFVQERSTDNILFMGRVLDPSK